MKTIWKFKLATIDRQYIALPLDAEILTVQLQEGEPCLWALVDPSKAKHKEGIVIHGTGHNMPETTGDYIGTYPLEGGNLIFNVFKEL